MPLTPAQLDHYRRDGYVVVPGFLTAREVAALQAEVRRLRDEGRLRNVATDGDGATTSQSVANLQICPIGLISPLIAALPWRPDVAETLGQVLDGTPVQHLDQIFLKPARHGAGTNWHTDNHYFRAADPRHGVGMWIAVDDATAENGTMRLIPRSHLRSWEHFRDHGSDHHFTCAAAVDEAEAVTCAVAAGGIVLFNYGIAHATGANRTDRDRAGLALHFVAAAHAPREDGYFAMTEAQWRFLAGPRNDGGRGAHGRDLRGVWAAEVARLAPAFAAA
jgi:hypothetical protein